MGTMSAVVPDVAASTSPHELHAHQTVGERRVLGWPDLAQLFGEEGLFAIRVQGDVLSPLGLTDGDYLVLRPLLGRADGWKTVAAEVRGCLGLYDYVPRRHALTRLPWDAFRLLPRAAGEPVAGPDDGVQILGVRVGVLLRG